MMTAPKSTVGRRWQAGFFLTPPRTSRFTPVPSLTIRLTVSTQNSIADQVMGVGGDGRRWADVRAAALPHIRGMVQAEARRALLYYGAATANEPIDSQGFAQTSIAKASGASTAEGRST